MTPETLPEIPGDSIQPSADPLREDLEPDIVETLPRREGENLYPLNRQIDMGGSMPAAGADPALDTPLQRLPRSEAQQ